MIMNTDQYLDKDESYNRLEEEYRKYGSLVIGYDFDGTVHDYHKKGYTYIKVIELIRNLKQIGFTLICWTAYKDLDYVRNFLIENNIPFDTINEGGIVLPWESRKIFFSALLDDRAGLLQVYNELTTLTNKILKENYEPLTIS